MDYNKRLHTPWKLPTSHVLYRPQTRKEWWFELIFEKILLWLLLTAFLGFIIFIVAGEVAWSWLGIKNAFGG